MAFSFTPSPTCGKNGFVHRALSRVGFEALVRTSNYRSHCYPALISFNMILDEVMDRVIMEFLTKPDPA
ncbi:hypothetical protein HNY73_021597 [Argiope bruennichi]|uniref:Uncharacterized protein n=1 Tax=Argiope bruennichi TaxID=94029 RepID=A0A8T0DZM2_ARGBR|nr:hypothetical protein HNY73_021597 [Argiope bruennichi]